MPYWIKSKKSISQKKSVQNREVSVAQLENLISLLSSSYSSTSASYLAT